MDPEKMAQNFALKLVPANVGAFITANKAAMVAAYDNFSVSAAAMISAIKGVLAQHDVAVTKVGSYIAFGSEVAKLVRKYNGGKIVNSETALLVAKWQARGCANAVLVDIRNNVFTIPAPS